MTFKVKLWRPGDLEHPKPSLGTEALISLDYEEAKKLYILLGKYVVGGK